MRRQQIRNTVEDLEDCEIISRGQFESAGQVYYEFGVIADDPDSVGEVLEELVEGSEWRVTVYEDGGRPEWYDREADERRSSDIRVKKNLYNEHMM